MRTRVAICLPCLLVVFRSVLVSVFQRCDAMRCEEAAGLAVDPQCNPDSPPGAALAERGQRRAAQATTAVPPPISVAPHPPAALSFVLSVSCAAIRAAAAVAASPMSRPLSASAAPSAPPEKDAGTWSRIKSWWNGKTAADAAPTAAQMHRQAQLQKARAMRAQQQQQQQQLIQQQQQEQQLQQQQQQQRPSEANSAAYYTQPQPASAAAAAGSATSPVAPLPPPPRDAHTRISHEAAAAAATAASASSHLSPGPPAQSPVPPSPAAPLTPARAGVPSASGAGPGGGTAGGDWMSASPYKIGSNAWKKRTTGSTTAAAPTGQRPPSGAGGAGADSSSATATPVRRTQAGSGAPSTASSFHLGGVTPTASVPVSPSTSAYFSPPPASVGSAGHGHSHSHSNSSPSPLRRAPISFMGSSSMAGLRASLAYATPTKNAAAQQQQQRAAAAAALAEQHQQQLLRDREAERRSSLSSPPLTGTPLYTSAADHPTPLGHDPKDADWGRHSAQPKQLSPEAAKQQASTPSPAAPANPASGIARALGRAPPQPAPAPPQPPPPALSHPPTGPLILPDYIPAVSSSSAAAPPIKQRDIFGAAAAAQARTVPVRAAPPPLETQAVSASPETAETAALSFESVSLTGTTAAPEILVAPPPPAPLALVVAPADHAHRRVKSSKIGRVLGEEALALQPAPPSPPSTARPGPLQKSPHTIRTHEERAAAPRDTRNKRGSPAADESAPVDAASSALPTSPDRSVSPSLHAPSSSDRFWYSVVLASWPKMLTSSLLLKMIERDGMPPMLRHKAWGEILRRKHKPDALAAVTQAIAKKHAAVVAAAASVTASVASSDGSFLSVPSSLASSSDSLSPPVRQPTPSSMSSDIERMHAEPLRRHSEVTGGTHLLSPRGQEGMGNPHGDLFLLRSPSPNLSGSSSESRPHAALAAAYSGHLPRDRCLFCREGILPTAPMMLAQPAGHSATVDHFDLIPFASWCACTCPPASSLLVPLCHPSAAALQAVLEGFVAARSMEASEFDDETSAESGYVQGLTYLAEILLVHATVAESIQMLLGIFDPPPSVSGSTRIPGQNFFRDFASMNVAKLAKRFSMLDEVLAANHPALAAYLRGLGLIPDVYFLEYEATVCTKQLPLEWSARVLDAWMLHGEVTVFRCTVALMVSMAPLLLRMPLTQLVRALREPMGMGVFAGVVTHRNDGANEARSPPKPQRSADGASAASVAGATVSLSSANSAAVAAAAAAMSSRARHAHSHSASASASASAALPPPSSVASAAPVLIAPRPLFDAASHVSLSRASTPTLSLRPPTPQTHGTLEQPNTTTGNTDATAAAAAASSASPDPVVAVPVCVPAVSLVASEWSAAPDGHPLASLPLPRTEPHGVERAGGPPANTHSQQQQHPPPPPPKKSASSAGPRWWPFSKADTAAGPAASSLASDVGDASLPKISISLADLLAGMQAVVIPPAVDEFCRKQQSTHYHR